MIRGLCAALTALILLGFLSLATMAAGDEPWVIRFTKPRIMVYSDPASPPTEQRDSKDIFQELDKKPALIIGESSNGMYKLKDKNGKDIWVKKSDVVTNNVPVKCAPVEKPGSRPHATLGSGADCR